MVVYQIHFINVLLTSDYVHLLIFVFCEQLNRKVYLGLYDNRTWPEPDSRDEQRVRDFMVQKYENKRFFVAPTEAMKEEARRMNEAALSKQPQTKPLRALLGENATKLVVGNSQVSVRFFLPPCNCFLMPQVWSHKQ